MWKAFLPKGCFFFFHEFRWFCVAILLTSLRRPAAQRRLVTKVCLHCAICSGVSSAPVTPAIAWSLAKKATIHIGPIFVVEEIANNALYVAVHSLTVTVEQDIFFEIISIDTQPNFFFFAGKGKFSQRKGGTKTCNDSGIRSCVRASVTEARVTMYVCVQDMSHDQCHLTVRPDAEERMAKEHPAGTHKNISA